VTWLNDVNDQVAGIGAVVIPGTMRDSLHILDTLLNLDAGPRPEMIATDTASYSDIVFGPFRLLGYRFSPRIADLADQRLWRATPPGALPADYGPLNAIARHSVNLGRIRTHWADMLRVTGSLVTNTVRAYDLLRMLGREGHSTALGQAFAEYGRIAKTLHLLAVVDPVDETYRRSLHRQLTIQESRHQQARKIFHGQRGELRPALPGRSRRPTRGSRLGAQRRGAVEHPLQRHRPRRSTKPWPPRRRHRRRPALTARHKHLNDLRRYTFTPRPSPDLRPLRDPDTADDE
jgi:TnpA family transposase